MLPLTDDRMSVKQLAEMCDGILFTGGHDVSPSVYGEEVKPVCGQCCPERDRMEVLLLKEALAANKAVLGICRGIQLINAALGGTLYQDLPTERPSEVEHHETPPYDKTAHIVELLEGTPLQKLLKGDFLPVNSYHHQAIKDLAPGLNVMAGAEDGVIEAVYMPEKRFVWAVQWHPEFSYKVNESSREIFRAFVQAADNSGETMQAETLQPVD